MKQQAMRRLAALALARCHAGSPGRAGAGRRPAGRAGAERDQAQQQYDDAQQALEGQPAGPGTRPGQVDAIAGQLSSVRAQADRVSASLNDTRQQLAEARQRLADAEAGLAAKQAEHDATWADTKSMMNAMQRMHDGGSIALLSQAADLYELLSFATVLDQMNGKMPGNAGTAVAGGRPSWTRSARRRRTPRRRWRMPRPCWNSSRGSWTRCRASWPTRCRPPTRRWTGSRPRPPRKQGAERRRQGPAGTGPGRAGRLCQKPEPKTIPTKRCTAALNFRCPLDSYGSITTQYGDPDPLGHPPPWHRLLPLPAARPSTRRRTAWSAWQPAISATAIMCRSATAPPTTAAATTHCNAHMSSYCVSVGQQVKAGDVIGYVGNTGQVSGSGGGYHLPPGAARRRHPHRPAGLGPRAVSRPLQGPAGSF